MSAEANNSNGLPLKPREPELSECCQRNCVNCVFVYYQKALDKWNKKVEAIKAR